MKTIIEYLQSGHISKVTRYNTNELHARPIHFDDIKVIAQNQHTVELFEKDPEVPFKTASDFIEEFIKLWDELPKEKNKFTVAELFYNGSNAIGFTLLTKSSNRVISWNEHRKTWSITDEWYYNTFYYNEQRSMFIQNLFTVS